MRSVEARLRLTALVLLAGLGLPIHVAGQATTDQSDHEDMVLVGPVAPDPLRPAAPPPRAGLPSSQSTNYCDAPDVTLSRSLALQSEEVIWRAVGLLPGSPVSARLVDPQAAGSARFTALRSGLVSTLCEAIGTFRTGDLDPGTFTFVLGGTTVQGATIELTAPLTIVASTQPTPTPRPLPAAPGGIQARALGPNTVRLDWADNSTNEDGFRIDSGGGQFRTRANVTTMNVGGLEPSSFYCFFVYAFNDAGETFGGVACAVTSAQR